MFKLNPDEMCSTLYCLGSDDYCYATDGWGAVDGIFQVLTFYMKIL
jgi:hypothetical protein